MSAPVFLITIDVEGDNLWLRPRVITTSNSRYLARFQALCEQYGLIPTYLTNYEMACCPVYQELARDAVRRNAAEVGMHLHAWHSPPFVPLTEDDYQHTPYLIEYPAEVLQDKVRFMTTLLEDTFERRVTSHRAGRWGLDSAYVDCLVECGYLADCSVTPHVSWRDSPGAPAGPGGPDYTDAPEQPYFIGTDGVCSAGTSGLLEVPMTVMRTSPKIVDSVRSYTRPGTTMRRIMNRSFPPFTWLRPNGANQREILKLLRRATEERRMYVEFMLHSSEFMPGGSPNFPNERSIEILYENLIEIFELARQSYRALGLSAFATEVASFRKYMTASEVSRSGAR